VLIAFSVSFLIDAAQTDPSRPKSRPSNWKQSNQARLNKIAAVRSKSTSLEQTAESRGFLKGLIRSEQDGTRPSLPRSHRNPPPTLLRRRHPRSVLPFAPTTSRIRCAGSSPKRPGNQSRPSTRCSRLTLRTAQKPFRPSAIPLQIELELAFPKGIGIAPTRPPKLRRHSSAAGEPLASLAGSAFTCLQVFHNSLSARIDLQFFRKSAGYTCGSYQSSDPAHRRCFCQGAPPKATSTRPVRDRTTPQCQSPRDGFSTAAPTVRKNVTI